MATIDDINKDIAVLVADDQMLIRNLVRTILKSFGFTQIIQAEDGLSAMEKLNSEDIGLVLCDWNMPNASGLEVLKAARSSEKNKNVPFIMLTAEAYCENMNEAKAEGVSEYVVKPFTPEVISKTIVSAMFPSTKEPEESD